MKREKYGKLLADYFQISIDMNKTKFDQENPEYQLKTMKFWRLVMFRVLDQVKTNRRLRNKTIFLNDYKNKDIRFGKGIFIDLGLGV